MRSVVAAFLLFAGTASAQDWLQQIHALYLRDELDAAQRLLDRAEGRQTLPARFEQALIWDAGGQHSQARAIYDSLIGTAWESNIAVPSAVNRVALGQLAAARQQFDTVAARSAQPAERDYAALWQLRLLAQEQPGDTAAACARAKPLQPQLRYQRALVELYCGQGDVRSVLSTVDAMHFDSDLGKRNARVEVLFFVAGHQQYVLQQPQQALSSYRQAWADSKGMLERPLIQQAIQDLQARTER